ncbi:unnamed protein product [Mucor fragilis]
MERHQANQQAQSAESRVSQAPKKIRKAVEDLDGFKDLWPQRAKVDDKNPQSRYLHHDIAEDVVVKVWNPLGDGNCGFRALAWQVYGYIEGENIDGPVMSDTPRIESNAYQRLKCAMLRQLEKNESQYRSCFKDFFDVDGVKNILCSKSEWFRAPDCAQLAADTFGRPIAVYPDQGSSLGSVTYLPVIDGDFSNVDVPNPGRAPLPLPLQNQGDFHWLTAELKRSAKHVWPIVNSIHSFAMKEKALSADVEPKVIN